eukprot:CAMPEP_0171937030 /NCGR_PEP_ID=MMETSP0993-20121228/34263_1 /TAXON_ID=483369 /ORGANISM="non described non described, Strain CCMP2098" /LENGTH=82 /DNA_ID=CAMNT_0012578307 /DNA_START=213 /DNA_END=457 /DNA_ORIENTATION=+
MSGPCRSHDDREGDADERGDTAVPEDDDDDDGVDDAADDAEEDEEEKGNKVSAPAPAAPDAAPKGCAAPRRTRNSSASRCAG